MQQRGGQYSEARFSCTAQVIRNNQNVLNELKLFIVRRTLEDKSQNTNTGGKNECGTHSVLSSNACYSESVLKADS